jgi:hypothetical protein
MVQGGECIKPNGEEIVKERDFFYKDMADFPILNEKDFVQTRKQMHSIAMVLGKFREILVKPAAKNENLWLKVTGDGFGIPPIEQYGDITISCNLKKLRIDIINPNILYTIDLEENSVQSIRNELIKILSELRIEFDGSRINFESEDKIELERVSSEPFLTQLVNYNGLLEEFWKSVGEGTKTGIKLWPHHFDNAFIWYSGKKINGAEQQIGIGVSNGDYELSLPYIYMVPWPVPGDINGIKLIRGKTLRTEGWTGVLLPYKAVEKEKTYDAQKELIGDFFNTTFEEIIMKF